MEKRAILSIDGGGTRGIIPTTVLMKLEGATGKPTRETFSFVAETLTEAADCTLNNAPVDLLVTARRVPDGKPWYFVRETPRNPGCTGRPKVVDSAVASTAAPTFFPPYRMPEPGGPAPGRERVGMLVNGGVAVTGNPIYEACGKEPAGEVDWEAILSGRDRRFRVGPDKTRHAGYAHRG